jgi:heptosyltransferase-2
MTRQPRLLLVKLGAIGDVVMAIPAAAAMHRAGYQVHWLASETVAPILRLYPWIHVIPTDETKLLRSPLSQRIPAILHLWQTLRHASSSYQTIATLYYDTRYRYLTLPLRAPRKILLSRSDRATQLLPGRHHTDEYARILTDAADGETPTQLAPIPPENLPAPPVPRTAKTRIVLVPVGARNLLRDDALRRWPVENYVAVASALLAAGHDVILSGGPDDAWASPSFAALPVTDLIAKLSLLETLALLESAALTITHDTGPLHLAGLTSTSILAIFGPTDPRGRLPQRCNSLALWGGEGFACRPCYDGRDYAPCHNNGCMQQITPAMVLTEAATLLTAKRENRVLPPRVRTPKHTPVTTFTQIL